VLYCIEDAGTRRGYCPEKAGRSTMRHGDKKKLSDATENKHGATMLTGAGKISHGTHCQHPSHFHLSPPCLPLFPSPFLHTIMLLVQKPPTFNLAQTVSYSHRRHPSAPPAVVVQPTRTPGLLSLSKPPRPSPQRPLPSQQRPTKPTPKSKPAPVARAPLLSSAEITEKKTPASVASPSPRGRLQAKNPQRCDFIF
jgi:hypothetical protein